MTKIKWPLLNPRRDWEEASRAYMKEAGKFRSRLPEAVRRLSKLRLHDDTVDSCELKRLRGGQKDLVVRLKELEVRLDPDLEITFHDVKDIVGWREIVGDTWLYDEIYPAPNECFELLVLMQRCEWRVVAKSVSCFSRRKGVYVIDIEAEEDGSKTKKRRKK